MDATVERLEVLRALRAVAPAVGGHLPVHSLLLLETGEAGIAVEATNGEWTFRAEAAALAVQTQGAALVPGRSLLGFLTAKHDAEVHIGLDEADFINVRCGDGSLRLSVVRRSEWPITDSPTEGPVEITEIDRKQILRVVFAAGRDPTHPLLMGVHIGAECVATDRRRVARAELLANLPNFTVPGDFLRHALREESQLTWSGDRVRIKNGRGQFESSVILGDFPETSPLFDARPHQALEMVPLRLAEALEATAVFDGAESVVTLSRNGIGPVLVYAAHAELGVVHDAVPADGDFDGAISFNHRMLTEAVAAVSAEDRLAFEFVTAAEPAVMRTPGFAQVLLPRVAR